MKRLNLLPQKRFTLWPQWNHVELSQRTQEAFLACTAAIALLSIISFLETKRIVQAENEHENARIHLADVVRREAEVHTVAQALNSLGAVARNVEDTRTLSYRRLALFSHLGDVLPDGMWLTSIANAQDTIALQGRARDAAIIGNALRNIEHDHAFRDPHLVHAREHDEAGSHFIDFELSIGLGEKS